MPTSRIELIEQAIRDYEEKYPEFPNPSFQPIPELAEKHKIYRALRSQRDQHYNAAAFKQYHDAKDEERIMADRILPQTDLGPVPEALKFEEWTKLAGEIAKAQSEPHGNEPTKTLETSVPTPASTPMPANAEREAPKRDRRRKKRALNIREQQILEVLKKGEVHSTVYCHALELKKIPPRQEWIDQGCPMTYPEAYRIPKWQKRIQDEKYRLSQFLPKKGTHRSSQTSATRRKRVNL